MLQRDGRTQEIDGKAKSIFCAHTSLEFSNMLTKSSEAAPVISIESAPASRLEARKTDRVQPQGLKTGEGEAPAERTGSHPDHNLLSGLEEALTETRRKIAEDRLDRAKEEMRILRQFSVSPAFLAQRAAAIGKELGSAATDYSELVRDSMETAKQDPASSAATDGIVSSEPPSTALPVENASFATPTELDQDTLNNFRSAIYQAWALLDLSLEDLIRENDLQVTDKLAAGSSREVMQSALHAMDNLNPLNTLRAPAFHI
ncbi:MAG: hypothetical protein ACJLUP_21400 [Agrobacterium tumefaciens]